MTTILVEGKTVAIKKGSSFELVSENRDFTDADAYTLSIDLPIRGCNENMTVFGMIHRQDYGSREKVLRCEIRSGDFCKHGALTVVGYEAGVLKCQFLEGRSLQNFQTTLDDVYVNALDMPYPLYAPGVSPTAHYGSYDDGAKWVALPWLYEQEGTLQNAVRFDNGSLVWDTTDGLPALSYQPYLIWVAKWVCEAIGYSYDFSQWEESSDRFLIMCNTLPASSMKNSFAQALPNWSVTEFFKQLELLLCGEFEFDHHRKRVDFTYTANVPGRDECVVIEDVADEFSGEVEYEDGKSEYKGLKNISYDGDDTDEWKSAQCTWLVEYMKGIPGGIVEVETENDFLGIVLLKIPWYTGKENVKGSDMGKMYHIRETDRYIIFRVEHAGLKTFPNLYSVTWEEVNKYRPLVSPIEGAEDVQIKIIPFSNTVVDEEQNSVIWLKPVPPQEFEDFDEEGIRQPFAMSVLNNGEIEKPEFYSKIYVGFWKGLEFSEKTRFPVPFAVPNWGKGESLALVPRYGAFLKRAQISVREKRTFKFLADRIPNVRSFFLISGKRYMCEKITATFTENGMSRLMKGEFYPVKESEGAVIGED